MGDDDDADGDDDGAHRCDISSRKLSVCANFYLFSNMVYPGPTILTMMMKTMTMKKIKITRGRYL